MVLLSALNCVAQHSTPISWYSSDRHYLKISIAETGWYYGSAKYLELAGFRVPPDSLGYLQLFRRGLEVAIQINTDADGRFSSLEFYGEKNDGKLDSSLYINSLYQPQNILSLYSDTAAYFLTLGVENGKRIGRYADASVKLETKPYCMVEDSQVYTNEYSAGNIYPMGATYENGVILSTYDEGEGYCGKLNTGTEWERIILHCKYPEKDWFQKSIARFAFTGRKYGKHHIEVRLEVAGKPQRRVGELIWEDFQTKEIELSFHAEDLSDSNEIILCWKPVATNDAVSIVSAVWRYPRSVLYADEVSESQHTIHLEAEMPYHFQQNSELRYFNVTDPNNCMEIEPGIRFNKTESRVLVVNNPLEIPSAKLINFENHPNLETEYLIITHPILRIDEQGEDPVNQYAQYRSSEVGGGYRVHVMDIEAVFDCFHYGERSPEAIRRMIMYLTDRGQLQFVFLVGRSKDPQTARFSKSGWLDDLIPNAGWPGSDMALAMKTNTEKAPRAGIGRLFVSKPKEVTDYLNKVKLLEAESKAAAWRKNILHLSGGTSSAEREIFRSYTDSFADKLVEANTGMNISTIAKTTGNVKETVDISKQINEGIALVTSFGHSSLNHVDLDFGKASAPENGFNNYPAFPAFWINGCAIGNMFFRQITLSTDWVNVPGKGAVLFVAHSHNGATPGLKRYSDAVYETIADEKFISRPFGSIMKEAASRYLMRYPWLTDIITVQQMNLQGDPAISIFPASKPDLKWNTSEVLIGFKEEGLLLSLVAANAGRYWKGNYTARLQIMQDGAMGYGAELANLSFPATDSIQFFIPIRIFQNPDSVQVELFLDPYEQLEEESETNNILNFTLNPSDYIPSIIANFTVSPNPFAGEVVFNFYFFGDVQRLTSKIDIYDVQGNRVDVIFPVINTGDNKIHWKPSGIAPGTYIYKFIAENQFEYSGKLIYNP